MEGKDSITVTGGMVDHSSPPPPLPTPPMPKSLPISASVTTNTAAPHLPDTSLDSSEKLSGSFQTVPPLGTGTTSPLISGVSGGLTMKKKRGRPRKYAHEGTHLMPLNPMPISASMPSPGVFTLTSPDGSMLKRSRGRPIGSPNKHHHRSVHLNPSQTPRIPDFDSSSLGDNHGFVFFFPFGFMFVCF